MSTAPRAAVGDATMRRFPAHLRIPRSPDAVPALSVTLTAVGVAFFAIIVASATSGASTSVRFPTRDPRQASDTSVSGQLYRPDGRGPFPGWRARAMSRWSSTASPRAVSTKTPVVDAGRCDGMVSGRDAVGACDALRRSIRELCAADHGNDGRVLAAWLANKTPDNVRAWITSASSFAVVAVEGADLLPEVLHRGAGKRMLHALEAQAARWGLAPSF